MSTTATATPAMRQYLEAKRQHRDAIVFFRMGDFYEMFYEDALTASRALELTLTSRSKDAGGNGIPMCGVPYHAADGYVARLVRKGFRVAICEQVEDPKTAKGLVKREVVRVVSPGTLTDTAYLEAREPSFMMAIVPGRRHATRHLDDGRTALATAADDLMGAALVDLSTGEFSATEYRGPAGLQALADEIAVLRPREIVVPDDSPVVDAIPEIARLSLPVTKVDAGAFLPEAATRTLLRQLNAHSLDGFGLDGHQAATMAAGALAHYLRETQKADLAHVRAVVYRTTAESLVIDPVTLRHLEVVTGSEGGVHGSLLHEIDRTATAMGARLLRAWLLRPLLALEPIRDRLDAVEELAFRTLERGRLREALAAVHDLERLVARASLGTAGPRDLVALRDSCAAIPRVRAELDGFQAPLLRSLVAGLDDLADVRDRIGATLLDEPPALARDGGFIRDGFDAALDEIRAISRSGRQVDRGHGGRRARAHRHRVAQGQVQPGLRLLHRDLEVEPAPRAARLPAEADDCRRRALHHAGAEGLRRARARRRRAHSRARAGDFRGAAPGGGRRGAARAGHAPASSRRSTCWPASPRRRRSATTPSRTCTTATSSWPPRCGIRWWNGARASRSFRTTSISTARHARW